MNAAQSSSLGDSGLTSGTPGRPNPPNGPTGNIKLQQAIRDFTEVLSPTERTEIQNNPSPERNILELTAAINDKVLLKFQAKRYVGRVQQFLAPLQGFSPIIDMFVSSNPRVSALVWGGLKLLIMVGTLKQLSD